MDALTAAALDSLVREILPKLTRELAQASQVPAAARTPSAELKFLVAEARELLGLMVAWTEAGGGEAADAAAAELQGALEAGPAAAVDEASLEMSDEEAAMLLAGMDGADVAAVMPAPAAKQDAEMTDDEAARLLAEMDGEAPAAAAAPADVGEMSDDEAARLLAEMDGTAAPAAGATAVPGEEMSDEEAARLLAEMEGAAPAPTPAAPTIPYGGGPTASADDEALAMLRQMGGAEDDGAAGGAGPYGATSSAQPRAGAPAAATAASRGHDAHDAHDVHDDHGGDEGEVEEITANDFASDPEMMKDFSTNIGDLMETLDTQILLLEQNPADRDTIEEIFRAAHTLKGAAGMFGFKAIERVMHRMENLFDQVRKGKMVPDAAVIDVMLQGLDVLKALVAGVAAGRPSGVKTAKIVRALSLAAEGKYVREAATNGAEGHAAAAPAAAPTLTSTIPFAPPAGGSAPAAPAGGGGSRGGPAGESTIRVDIERLDALVNLVGELVIDRTRFSSIEEQLRATAPQLKIAGHMAETVQLFGRHMTEIHETIMKIRMVPIGNAFNKFSRVVRDLSRQLGKEIELYVEGESTELDKTLVEQIGDPLIHLIRNSCDHGIEMPDARAAAGKRRSGRIDLSARQEGNHIVVTIQDDGKGIPAEIIRKKAVERGLIAEDAVMTQRDIFNLIFEPGFSTAEKVTNISGRGVGMDVVRKQISRLKGHIDIDSTPGNGTTITIRLPLTLAIMQSLLVEAGGEVFAIPLSAVVESVRLKPEEIQSVGDAEVIKRHGRVVPLGNLGDTMELGRRADASWYGGGGDADAVASVASRAAARRADRIFVVILGSGDRRYGLVVDQLLHQQEMVIKPLGPLMRDVPCVAGGAVLGDGQVVLVLDLQEVEDRFRSRTRHKPAA
jgi:two-component system chemotaxis sensor kinase CheA